MHSYVQCLLQSKNMAKGRDTIAVLFHHLLFKFHKVPELFLQMQSTKFAEILKFAELAMHNDIRCHSV